MKVAALFFYVLLFISHQLFGDNGLLWSGFYTVLHLLMIGILCGFLSSYVKEEKERLFFIYIKYLSFANAIYTGICTFSNDQWVIKNTDVSSWIIGLGFVAFLCHLALRNK